VPEEPTGNMATRYVVARARDIPAGERLIVNVSGRSIGIFNVEGSYYALLNRCPHRGGQLCKGDVIGLVESDGPGDLRLDKDQLYIACPWHGWEYELGTGQSWWNPQRTRARPFPVSVDSGQAVASEIAAGATQAPSAPNAQFVDNVSHRIKGPYTAEVVPVAVEDDYIVISLSATAGQQARE
jgi:nitrite reductase/ring-hydroxylating ferredoxin subunit